jgi:hypothetical protein
LLLTFALQLVEWLLLATSACCAGTAFAAATPPCSHLSSSLDIEEFHILLRLPQGIVV